MMDDNTPIHERRKLVKTYKNVLPQKWTKVAKVCWETYSKNDKKKPELKNGHRHQIYPRKLKGNAEREREK